MVTRAQKKIGLLYSLAKMSKYEPKLSPLDAMAATIVLVGCFVRC